jgi:PRC-barrel domain
MPADALRGRGGYHRRDQSFTIRPALAHAIPVEWHGYADLGIAVRGCGEKTAMFQASNIREWRGHDVVDPEGHKIGELEAVYVNTTTDLPSFATVKVGMPTRHRLVFVPLDQATVGPGYLKVSYDKKQVKGAPSIGTDGELPADDEEAVFKHYELPYQPGAGGERLLARR